MSKTRLVYKDAKSNKFWQIEAKGSSINILYGKVGTNGQTSIKNLNHHCSQSWGRKINQIQIKKRYKKVNLFNENKKFLKIKNNTISTDELKIQ